MGFGVSEKGKKERKECGVGYRQTWGMFYTIVLAGWWFYKKNAWPWWGRRMSSLHYIVFNLLSMVIWKCCFAPLRDQKLMHSFTKNNVLVMQLCIYQVYAHLDGDLKASPHPFHIWNENNTCVVAVWYDGSGVEKLPRLRSESNSELLRDFPFWLVWLRFTNSHFSRL